MLDATTRATPVIEQSNAGILPGDFCNPACRSLGDWLDADGVDETNKVTEILFFKDGSEKFLKQGNARAFLETLRDLRKQTKEPN